MFGGAACFQESKSPEEAGEAMPLITTPARCMARRRLVPAGAFVAG